MRQWITAQHQAEPRPLVQFDSHFPVRRMMLAKESLSALDPSPPSRGVGGLLGRSGAIRHPYFCPRRVLRIGGWGRVMGGTVGRVTGRHGEKYGVSTLLLLM